MCRRALGHRRLVSFLSCTGCPSPFAPPTSRRRSRATQPQAAEPGDLEKRAAQDKEEFPERSNSAQEHGAAVGDLRHGTDSRGLGGQPRGDEKASPGAHEPEEQTRATDGEKQMCVRSVDDCDAWRTQMLL